MAAFIAMIACTADMRTPAFDELARALVRLFPALPAPTACEGGGEDPLLLTMGAARVAIMSIDQPIPWPELEERSRATRWWPEAEPALRAHAGHLIVSALGELTPLAGATLATQVSAALVETMPSALGVYWGSAGTLLRKDVFVALAGAIKDDAPPTAIWVDFRVGPATGRASRGFTRGLAAFELPEFEVLAAPEPARVLLDRLMGLAGYALGNGPAIRPGHTVGATADEKVRVIDAGSSFGQPGRVLQLVFDQGGGPARASSWLSRLLGR